MSAEVTTRKRTRNDELYEKAIEARKQRTPRRISDAVRRILENLDKAAGDGEVATYINLNQSDRDIIPEIVRVLKDEHGVDASEHPTLAATVIAELVPPPSDKGDEEEKKEEKAE